MLEVERVMLQMQTYNLSLSYSEYLEVLENGIVYKRRKGSCLEMYGQVFCSLTALKQDYFNAGDCFIFLSQLLFGCRCSEVKTITTSINGHDLDVFIFSLKGTDDRVLSYDMRLPIIQTYMRLRSLVYKPPSYKSYYRSLLKASPNLYVNLNLNHLTTTHLVRHFYIQVLYYVFGLSRQEVTNMLCWKKDETIDSYIDQNIFKSLYKGGEHGNTIIKADLRVRHSHNCDNRSSRSNSPDRKKVKKKVNKKSI